MTTTITEPRTIETPDATLLVDPIGWSVEDADGGVWWPTDTGREHIEAAADPYAEAVRLCTMTTEWGDWRA